MSSKLRIAFIQSYLHWEEPEANRSLFDTLLPAPGTCDLVLLPEMFATGFSMNPELSRHSPDMVQWMQQRAVEGNYALAGSLPWHENNQCFNRFFCCTPSQQQFTYDKRHLFAFAKEDQVFSPGNQALCFEFRGWKIAAFVCYDLRFPVWMRRRAELDYDLALVPANWPERRSEAWKSLLKARAIENQSYVLGLNRVGYDGNGVLHSGDSLLFDALGKTLAAARPFHTQTLSAELSKETLEQQRRQFPFQNEADGFVLI